ncbi:sporulation protein [Edaphobacillus lindanitolerans]|uniref:Sporulation-control protein n=1 Tax=Edaphobacillus lindanitolerans TaxID=550447 RepID=A0A1U7PLH2_9BACI|nr:sporulation protein [Edaphobacillus lindanitolerans]SIT80917.1 sporulation-control protein [Edaphobacillus lindanitolerans]
MKSFLSKIEIGALVVDTVVDNQMMEEGETLNGTIYIDGGDADEVIDHITLEVLIRPLAHSAERLSDADGRTLTKQSIELVGDVRSKGTRMIPFEIVPDERWEVDTEQSSLMLRTTAHIPGGTDAHDEDQIQYG